MEVTLSFPEHDAMNERHLELRLALVTLLEHLVDDLHIVTQLARLPYSKSTVQHVIHALLPH